MEKTQTRAHWKKTAYSYLTLVVAVMSLPGIAQAATVDGYRWRADDGTEVTASWSASGGTPITGIHEGDTHRLRFTVANRANAGLLAKLSTSSGLASDAYDVNNAAVASDGLYAYVATGWVQHVVQKVDLATGTIMGVSYDYGAAQVNHIAVDATGTYGYMTSQDFDGNLSIVKILLSDMTYVDSTILPNGNPMFTNDNQIAVNPQDGNIYVLTMKYAGATSSPAILKISPSLAVSASYFNSFSMPESWLSRMTFGADGSIYAIDYAAATDNHGIILKISPSNMTAVAGSLSLLDGADINRSYGLAGDPINGYLYVTTQPNGDNSINIIKVSTSSSMSVVANVVAAGLPDGNDNWLHDGYVSPTGDTVFFGSSSSPGFINAYSTATLAKLGNTSSGDFSGNLYGAQLFTAGDKIYFESGELPNILGFGMAPTADGNAQISVTPRLQYAVKTSSCSAVSSWTQVPAVAGSGDAWEMANSGNLTDGAATTNVTNGLVDTATTFVAGQSKDTGSEAGAATLNVGDFSEYEYSIRSTADAGTANYCFRLSNGVTPFSTYYTYAEAATEDVAPEGFSDVSFTPPNPTTDDLITLSATAADADGIGSIELFIDGTTAAHRVMTCSNSPAASPFTCTFPYGALLSGAHTLYARYTDGALNVSLPSAGTPILVLPGVPGGSTKTTVNRVTLGRLKAGVTTTARVDFNLNETLTGKLTVTFPSGFVINSLPTSMSSCLSGAAISGQTVTAVKDGCSGPIFLAGIGVTLPSAIGLYHFSWINDSPGWADVVVVAEDQVDVNAQVDPSLSFDVTAQNDCSTGWAAGSLAFTAHSYVVNLGHLNSVNGYKAASNGGTVPYICTLLNTNATGGAVVTVNSANVGLRAGNGDMINSVTGAADGTNATPNYGIFVGAEGQNDAIVPAAGHVASLLTQTGVSEVFGVTAGGADIWNTTGDATAAAWHTVGVAVAVTATTPAHQDYTDTLTFVATATF